MREFRFFLWVLSALVLGLTFQNCSDGFRVKDGSSEFSSLTVLSKAGIESYADGIAQIVISHLTDPKSLLHTVADDGNEDFQCLRRGEPCLPTLNRNYWASRYIINNVYDQNGELYHAAGAVGRGLTLDGKICNGFDNDYGHEVCVFSIEATWLPLCNENCGDPDAEFALKVIYRPVDRSKHFTFNAHYGVVRQIRTTLIAACDEQGGLPGDPICSLSRFRECGNSVDDNDEIPNGTGLALWNGNQYGSCIVDRCNQGFHVNRANNSCDSNELSCEIPNGYGHREWNSEISSASGTMGDYGACIFDGCQTNFHRVREEETCHPNYRSCPIANGIGEQVWTGTDWGPCTVKHDGTRYLCNTGYKHDSGQCVRDAIHCHGRPGTPGSTVVPYQVATQGAHLRWDGWYSQISGGPRQCQVYFTQTGNCREDGPGATRLYNVCLNYPGGCWMRNRLSQNFQWKPYGTQLYVGENNYCGHRLF